MTSRRDALKTIALGAVGASAAGTWVESLVAHAQAHHTQAGLATGTWKPRVLTPWQDRAVALLAERIIPETDTPGALAAGVNRFIDTALADAPPTDREAFLRGLSWVDARSKALFGEDIGEASIEQQTALLAQLSDEREPDGEAPIGRQFFQALKAMTITGYYTSEVGLRQELGDDGQMFLMEFAGCEHPEHQR
jgi:hypothetical protein